MIELEPDGTWGITSLKGDVAFIPSEKTVNVFWKKKMSSAVGAPIARGKRSIATRYYPTSIIALDDSTLVVAGLTPAARVVVEVWAFSPRQIVINQTPGGAPLYTVSGGDRISVNQVLDIDGSKGAIEGMFVDPHQALSGAFLHFDGTNELSYLDASTGSLTVIAKPDTVVGSMPAAPDLALEWVAYASHNDDNLGNLLIFYLLGDTIPDSSSDPSKIFWLAFFDSDENGTFESHLSLTKAGGEAINLPGLP